MNSDALESPYTTLSLWKQPPGAMGDGPEHCPELTIHLADITLMGAGLLFVRVAAIVPPVTTRGCRLLSG